MSLIRIAARISLVKALRGRTVVGDNVRDSMIGAFDVAADGSVHTETDKPFIAVYTDAAKVENLDLRPMIENGATQFVLEWGVASSMLEQDTETGEKRLLVDIPATDDAFEFQNDLVGRQIGDAIADPDNVWAEVFRSLCFRFMKSERSRTSNADSGTRLAAHQSVITADLMDDPVTGEDVPQPLAVFFGLADTSGDDVLILKAAKMKALLTGENEPWEEVQKRCGMTADELCALGLGPIASDVDRATPALSEVAVSSDIHDNVIVSE